MNMTADPVRLWTAAGFILVYAFLCMSIGFAELRRRRAVLQRQTGLDGQSAWLVAYASQTGTAEEIAGRTADTLRLAGMTVLLSSFENLTVQDLIRAQRVLFIASTYGEGDPPDEAAIFVKRLLDHAGKIGEVHYALLALGDTSYAHFCGFGRMLDQQLQQLGAQPMFERIDVDRNDASALERWRQNLVHLVGTSDLPDWSGPEFNEWKLAERRLLNPGSAGAPVFHLELEPQERMLPQWQSGDLAQVLAPADQAHPREYSIASIPGDGRVHLLIRLHRRPDGTEGVASGWLGLQAAIGDVIKMRLRSHKRFQLEGDPGRPLILIGNGTGIAGLRSHLKARANHAQAQNWLIFGERNARCDFHYQDDIQAWQASGMLQRVDLAFSRDGGRHRYVQDCLADAGEMLRDWISKGAAIYVCGSLSTMAAGVDDALAVLLGREELDKLASSGRYRRDVY